MRNGASTLIRFTIALSLFCGFCSCMFTITNNCPDTIWPGTLAGAGTPELPTTGFALESGHSVEIQTPPGWSGRIWARTGCQFDASGAGACQTGDCGGKIGCNGIGAAPPATLFEITLGKGQDQDFYDVSLVDGYNLPLVATPIGASTICNATGCTSDLNSGCPKELQVMDGGTSGGVVACKSACEAFGLDEYCCNGEYGNPTTCKPTYYSNVFKIACPRAYSYAYDDGSSTFTCKAFDYQLTFCPTLNWLRRSNLPATAPPANGQRIGGMREIASSESNILSADLKEQKAFAAAHACLKIGSI
ncbi:pathogenesis-related thaumatin-like protein 3.5 [Aristolochia californica]|uniref:pathogenesis-related thaumatin-like protein 3.5 n=1 Tax=Aristolochia californica TaxID=171875 RepID=UPI0035D60393